MNNFVFHTQTDDKTVGEEMEFSDKPKDFTWNQKLLPKVISMNFTYILRQSSSENTLILACVDVNFCVCMGYMCIHIDRYIDINV